ncbi:MAG: tripartite tricarboxylate transporter substrate binding protein [Burkholderiales bacterium]
MRTINWVLTATLGLLLVTGGVHAQQRYPTKPIRLIVPYAPGGGTDIVARMLAQKLSESLGASVVVDNRSGAAGTIGTETAVRANPDGYTMIMVSAAYAANASLYNLPYNAVNDVVPIALIGETGLVVTLHPSVPVKSIKELIAYDKANPGKLNYGSSGIGGTTHLAAELFNQMASTKMAHVPYKGTGAALIDLLGGQIQLTIGGMPPMIPQIKLNRLRGIAVTTAKRSNAVPDIPTVGETVPGYEALQWFAVLGPTALPKDIVARWNREIDRIVQLPDVKERMTGEGMEPAGGSSERFREVLKRDIAKWQKVVKTAGIKPGN